MIAPNQSGDIYSSLSAHKPVNRTDFSYKSVESSNKRKTGPKVLHGEDFELRGGKRQRIQADARDQQRNFSTLSWMIRKHVSYTSQFAFKIRTTDQELTRRLKDWFEDAQKKKNFDVSERHALNRASALFEMAKVTEGDAAMVRIKGGSIQLVESSLICKPTKDKNGKPVSKRVQQVNEQGLILNKWGAVTHYCICKWDEGQRERVFDYLAKSENVFFDGYYTRVSQTRGISPLASALNTMRDLHESYDYTLMKIKVSTLFGVAFYRDAPDGDEWNSNGSPGIEHDDDGAESDAPTYQMDMTGGVMNLDLNDGDRAEVVESKTPHEDTQGFWAAMARCALMALDIPYGLYNSDGMNLALIKAQFAEYERTSREKQDANRVIWEEWRDWQIELAESSDPEISRLINATYGDDRKALLRSVMVIPIGAPLLDRKSDAEADDKEISNGTTSRQRICKRRNQDWFEILDELDEEEKQLKERGVTVTIGSPGANGLNIETPAPAESAAE